MKICLTYLMAVVTLALAQYQYETIVKEPIGPGMVHRRIIEQSQPWQIHVVEIDLRNPYVRFESVKARDCLTGRETTSSMAGRSQYKGRRVVAAINADFFQASGAPVNLQIRNGEILRKPIARTVIGFSDSSKPVWGRLQFSASVTKGAHTAAIQDINDSRDDNELVLYNRWFGTHSCTDSSGCEAALHPLTGWQVNDTLTCIVDATALGNMAIPANGAVLSGKGLAAQFMQSNINKGDMVKLWLGLPPSRERILEMVGGLPQIVVDGREEVAAAQRLEGGSNAFTHSRHPRTAVGINADSSKFFLVTVDGRQPAISSGMSLNELADFLIHIGVHQGINLDGGGSTTMVVDDVVVNSPSDATGERAVANALLLISTAPNEEISRLVLKPKTARVLAGQSLALHPRGLDQHWNTITRDPARFSYTCDTTLGTVSADGVFNAGMLDRDGTVLVRYGAVVDSMTVQVRTIAEFAIRPKRPLADRSRSVSFMTEIKDSDGCTHSTGAIWSCLDPCIGRVDSLGMFHAEKTGTARVVAAALGIQDTAIVTVMPGKSCQAPEPR